MKMKKTKREPRRSGEAVGVKVHGGSGNVFADLGLSDAEERLAKAELAHRICSLIKSKKLTQTQAARRLGVDQPKVSALVRGRLEQFSTERLFRFFNRLDQDVLIVIRPTEPQRRAGVRVVAQA
jgi:predicted XRE-type DNA-binding protein